MGVDFRIGDDQLYFDRGEVLHDRFKFLHKCPQELIVDGTARIDRDAEAEGIAGERGERDTAMDMFFVRGHKGVVVTHVTVYRVVEFEPPVHVGGLDLFPQSLQPQRHRPLALGDLLRDRGGVLPLRLIGGVHLLRDSLNVGKALRIVTFLGEGIRG